jgi:thioredoxin-like negative regulator of GroEL
MKPIVHGLEAEYGDRAGFVYLDVDDPATAGLREQLGYRGQPHFFLLDGAGNTIGSWQGAVDEAELRQAIEGALGG